VRVLRKQDKSGAKRRHESPRETQTTCKFFHENPPGLPGDKRMQR
jgi:hypothetical protein